MAIEHQHILINPTSDCIIIALEYADNNKQYAERENNARQLFLLFSGKQCHFICYSFVNSLSIYPCFNTDFTPLFFCS